MDDKRPLALDPSIRPTGLALWQIAALVAYFLYVASAFWILAGPFFVAAILAAGGPIAGVLFVVAVVRWINRRDDPRHPERPAGFP